MSGQHPTFAALSHDESVALLERNHVGRIAFAFHDRVDIEPISYVFRGAWIYARTSPGTKLETMHHHPWVAFEVDEVEGPYDWRSVVVHGALDFPDRERGAKAREEFDAALDLLRSRDIDALTEHDPTPQRRSLFRVHADEITGRQATTQLGSTRE